MLVEWWHSSIWIDPLHQFLSSQGWSAPKDSVLGPHPISNLHQLSLRLSGESSLSLCWWLHSAVTSLILLTDRQQPLPSPQTSIKITNWSNAILLMYPYCPPFIFPYPSSLPASLVCPSPSTFSLHPAVGVSPFSCCSLCYVLSWFVLCNCSSMSLDHV